MLRDRYHFLFDNTEGFIRIPVWGHIPLSLAAKRVISHPTFFRLRGIKQLSFVEYVFPGATHTRLEHCIGVFHLTKNIFQSLVLNEINFQTETDRQMLDPENIKTLLAAALLHDVGHYPHAHLIETLTFSGKSSIDFTHHQVLAENYLFEKIDGISIADILESDWKINPNRVMTIINGNKQSEPLAKIVSGTLDPDKMDYLIRDAHHCSVPYASVDISRLIESYVLDSKHQRLSISEKGIAPFESLIFSKYMMTRHIYWHHTVRTFGAMLKLFIQEVLDQQIISASELSSIFYQSNDEELLFRLTDAIKNNKNKFDAVELLDLIKKRQPYKNMAHIQFSRTEPTSVKTRTVHLPNGILDHTSDRSGRRNKITDPLIKKMSDLHHDAYFRRLVETELAEKLNHLTNNKYQIKSFEVLLDTPGFHSIFEYDDLKELQIYSESTKQFFPLNGSQLTMFQPEFISRFEPYAKDLQILVHPRLLDKVLPFQDQLISRLFS